MKRRMFDIGDQVEITKSGSDWKGVKGDVVNFGIVGDTWEYLVRNSGDDQVPGGDFWWVQDSLRKA